MILLLLVLLGLPAFSQVAKSAPPYGAGDLCADVVSVLYPAWRAGSPRERLARVEVRNCPVESWGFLQIAAWNADADRPSLIVDTRRMTIVKAAIAGNVFVLETAGASSNVVQVVMYREGRPYLVLDDATRADVHVDMTWKSVRISWIPEDGEDGPERIHEFATGRN